MSALLARSTCDCGAVKTLEHSFKVCDHCDMPCEIRGCLDYRRYNAAVSKRLNA